MQLYQQDEKKIFKSELDSLVSSLGIKVVSGPSSMFNSEKNVIVLSKNHADFELTHEAFHSWLSVRKGFNFDSYSNSAEGLKKIDMNLPATSMNRNLSVKVMYVADLENVLTSGIPAPGIFTEDVIWREQAKGPKELYSFFKSKAESLKSTFTECFGQQARYSGMAERSGWLGNMIDETHTLGAPGYQGHPMDDFQEFFASFMASVAYNPQSVIEKVGKLEGISKKHPESAPLIKEFSLLLENAALFGIEAVLEMEKARDKSQPKSKLLDSLHANLLIIAREAEKIGMGYFALGTEKGMK